MRELNNFYFIGKSVFFFFFKAIYDALENWREHIFYI